jgi:hypothetical protein
MNDQRVNVIALPGRRDNQPIVGGPEAFRAVAGYLDELSLCLERLSPHATWSSLQWKIASTPFRMRLVGVRRRLEQLAASRDEPGQADRHWLLEVDDALTRIDRRIDDLSECLRSLQHEGTAGEARARETDGFIARRSELADTTSRVRRLLQRPTGQAGRS